MSEAKIDWREFEAWRVPGFEVRLFPEWFAARHRELLKIGEMPEGSQKETALVDFFSQMVGQFNGVLRNPDLRIFGRPDSPNNESEEIIFSLNHKIVSWPFDFPPKSYDSKVIISAGDEMREYYDVYVFPFLAAPRLAGRLSGFVDEVLAWRLWADPQLLRLQTGLSDRVGALGDGQALVPIADRPINITHAILTILLRLKMDPEIAKRSADIIADRLSRLFSLLPAGHLALHGRDRSGRLRNVPVTLWREADVSLCLASAAIYRGASMAWTDLRIGKLEEDASGLDIAAVIEAPQPTSENAGPILYTARKIIGKPVSKARLNDFDAMIAERLASPIPLYRTRGEVDYELTRREACRIEGIPLDGPEARALELDPETVGNVGEWLRGLLPRARLALCGESEDDH